MKQWMKELSNHTWTCLYIAFVLTLLFFVTVLELLN